MAGFGTAPRRANGVWITRTGRQLDPAGQHFWTQQYLLGVTDGQGHYNHQLGLAAHQARLGATPTIRQQGGQTLGTYARGQQNKLERQAELGFSMTPVGGPIFAAQDLVRGIKHGNPVQAGAGALGLIPGWGGAARRAAKAEKLARGLHKVGNVEKAVGPESFVTDALGAAKEARVKQNELYSAERAKRIKESGQAFQEAGGGLEGHAASLARLRGELPKLRFDDLTGISDQDMGKLMNIVEDNPKLSEWEALSLRAGLIRARAGHVPRDFEIALMRRAFNVETATEFANPSGLQKALRTAADVINIPRAVMSSADVSAVLRQSLVATLHRPGVAAKNIGPMFRMMFDQKFYDDAMTAIQRDPEFDRAVTQDGLKMTDVHGPMGTREEAYPSGLAERIPVAGHVVKGSSRAYTGFINVMRWHVYNELLDLGRIDGAVTPKLRKDAAEVANWSTGRGRLPGKALESAAPLLNTVFFSPRLLASRFQTFNPFFYAGLDPVARKYAMTAAVKTLITGMTVLGAAAAVGAKVGTDPTSADFGKIRIGKTRLDVWGGHQQWVRLAGQLLEGKITSTTTGKAIPLSGGFGGSSRWDVSSRFLQGKFSPPASLIRDWTHHTDFQGKPFSWKKAVISRSYPLLIQDMLDTFHAYGIGPAVGIFGIGSLGIGVQTYGPQKKKPASRKPATTRSHRSGSLLPGGQTSSRRAKNTGGGTSLLP